MLNNFCCDVLKESLKTRTVFYNESQRLFYIKQGNYSNNLYILDYCPFCGNKFLENLTDEYFEAIRDPVTGKELSPLPEEFKTDEWWRKRGL